MKLGVWDYFMLLVTVLLCAYPLWSHRVGL